MSKKKKVFLVSGIILAVGLIIGGIFGGLYLNNLMKYREKVKNIKIDDIDISKLEDGIYIGSYDAILNSAEIEVTVVGGQITNITFIKHKTVKGESAESIIEAVKEEQSLKIGFVTGATNSSKVILKAIEQALKSTPKPL